TRSKRDWSSDVYSSDLLIAFGHASAQLLPIIAQLLHQLIGALRRLCFLHRLGFCGRCRRFCRWSIRRLLRWPFPRCLLLRLLLLRWLSIRLWCIVARRLLVVRRLRTCSVAQ